MGTSFAPALIVSLKDDGTIPTKELFVQTVCAGRPEKGMPALVRAGARDGQDREHLQVREGPRRQKISAGRPAVKSEPEAASSQS